MKMPDVWTTVSGNYAVPPVKTKLQPRAAASFSAKHRAGKINFTSFTDDSFQKHDREAESAKAIVFPQELHDASRITGGNRYG
jgi:hypothetical protein